MEVTPHPNAPEPLKATLVTVQSPGLNAYLASAGDAMALDVSAWRGGARAQEPLTRALTEARERQSNAGEWRGLVTESAVNTL
jgi:hypothetical protein